MQTIYPKVFIALPVMDEAEILPELIKCIDHQDYQGDMVLFVCINQPDSWWDDKDRIHICHNNTAAETLLKKHHRFPVHIIDRYSKGKGWTGKKYGVGWARKILMDEINSIASPNDIIISIDADTVYNKEYISSVVESFQQHPDKIAMSVPYYHNLTDDDVLNRALLHYEIYMRYYSINLWRISFPYNFTALGSAIALPVWAYRKIDGISPHKSGEDFYFLQKLRKSGELILWNEQKVYPATRYSDRVFFGTGPALIKGKENKWSSYPIYHYSKFDSVKELYDQFKTLYETELSTPIIDFMKVQFNTDNLWQPLRDNNKNRESFKRACENKIDSLRILQYLKAFHEEGEGKDERNLIGFLEKFYLDESNRIGVDLKTFSFRNSSISELNALRDFLVKKEEEYQLS